MSSQQRELNLQSVLETICAGSRTMSEREAMKALGIYAEPAYFSRLKHKVRGPAHPAERIAAAHMHQNELSTPITNKTIFQLVNEISSKTEYGEHGMLKTVIVDEVGGRTQSDLLRALRACAGLTPSAIPSYLDAIITLQTNYSSRPPSLQRNQQLADIPVTSIIEANQAIGQVESGQSVGQINTYLATLCYSSLFNNQIWSASRTQLPLTHIILDEKSTRGEFTQERHRDLEQATGESVGDAGVYQWWKLLVADMIAKYN